MVIPRTFIFYFVFCVVVVLLTFGLSLFYQCGVVRCLIAAFYLCGGHSNK